MAGTVREVGMGFKLVHRADDDPERFGVLAMHAPPWRWPWTCGRCSAGRGIAPQRAYSAVASRMDVHSKNGSMSYTIDGDLYRTQAPVAISLGPPIVFLKPPSALIVRGRAAIPWAASDELVVSVWTACGCGSRETRTWA